MATRDHRTEPRQTNEETGLGAPTQGRHKGQFGLRMAVLAGVIAAAGGSTAGLTGPVNSVVAATDTTCCSGGNAAVVKTV